jgi:hypothetical protein
LSAISPEKAIEAALSVPRIATYVAATKGTPVLGAAIALYSWNAQVSAALLNPLHLCEVVVRNAVSDALSTVYGTNWPWDATFYNSLPNPSPPAFNPRRELARARHGQPSVGKVVAELKFVFWQTMFTGRFDGRLWNPHLRSVMPYLDPAKSEQQLRKAIHDELESLRLLRNRIAHHEPIFRRSIGADMVTIRKLISHRCPITAAWMFANQQVSVLMATKPP